MTIHSDHPFATPDDEVRRFRGRLGGAVSLLTSGSGSSAAGLTVSSLLVANGSPGRLLVLLDPDSDLAERLLSSGRGVCQLLSWRHRDLAAAFAGQLPAPGGPFRMGAFTDTAYGPLLGGVSAYCLVSVEEPREMGWSLLMVATLDEVHLEADDTPLGHRRGHYLRLDHD